MDELIRNSEQDAVSPYPYFHGLAPFAWKANRYYQVYLLPEELIFLCLKTGGELSQAFRGQFGLVGVLAGDAIDQAKKNQKALSQQDKVSIDEWIAQHKNSFRARRNEFSEVSLNPKSFWLAYAYSYPHAGVLRFNHSEQGKMTLLLQKIEDMQTAFRHLPPVLGFNVAVNVEWDQAKKRFTKMR
jgi:hypothetical protein